jgi:hypothetical protein
MTKVEIWLNSFERAQVRAVTNTKVTKTEVHITVGTFLQSRMCCAVHASLQIEGDSQSRSFPGVGRSQKTGRLSMFRRTKIPISLQCLGVDLIERRNIVVPLEQSCRGAGPLNRTSVQVPDRIEHRMIMSIQYVLLKLGVARDMNLCDSLSRNTVYVVQRIEAVILRRHVDVIDIKENAAVCRFNNFVQKLPLGHLRLVKLGVAADVLRLSESPGSPGLRGFALPSPQPLQRYMASGAGHECICRLRSPSTDGRRARESSFAASVS